MRLSVRDLRFSYGRDEVLRGVDFEIDHPELVCILGPNGAGKTTMAKCLDRILRPTSGEIVLDGEDVLAMRHMDLARKVAYVPNRVSNTFRTTVSEFVLMGRFPHAQWSNTDHDLDVADSAMGMMGLHDLAGKDVGEVSSGQMQRAMIARGLAQEPEILILDEPTSNLDAKSQMDVMGFLRDFARGRGVAVLSVCHDLNIAATFADRIIIVADGRVFADGAPDEVLTESNISAVYGVRSRVIDVDGRPHVILLPGDPI